MCNNGAACNNSPWNTQFYHQYLQQHARMTQWIQNLHQNLPQPFPSFTSPGTQSCNLHSHYQHQQFPLIQQGHYPSLQGHYTSHQGHYSSHQGHYTSHQGIPQQHFIPQQGHFIPERGPYIPQSEQHVPQRRHHEKPRHNSYYEPHYRSRSQTSAEYVKDNESEEPEEDNEDDGEYVLNVDAILAFRAAKEESEKEEDAVSEESFEFVDTILDENFEFVGLDDAGQMQKMFGRKTAPDASGDAEYDREARIVLFGDKADRIAGLETSLEIMFDHLNDLHQPVVYPNVV